MSKTMDFNLECNRMNRRISKLATEWMVKRVDKKEYDWEWQQKCKFSYVQWSKDDTDDEVFCWFKNPSGGWLTRYIPCADLGLDPATCKRMKNEAIALEEKVKGQILNDFKTGPISSLIYPDTRFGWVLWGKATKKWHRIDDGNNWEQVKMIPVMLKVRNGGLWENKEIAKMVSTLDAELDK